MNVEKLLLLYWNYTKKKFSISTRLYSSKNISSFELAQPNSAHLIAHSADSSAHPIRLFVFPFMDKTIWMFGLCSMHSTHSTLRTHNGTELIQNFFASTYSFNDQKWWSNRFLGSILARVENAEIKVVLYSQEKNVIDCFVELMYDNSINSICICIRYVHEMGFFFPAFLFWLVCNELLAYQIQCTWQNNVLQQQA